MKKIMALLLVIMIATLSVFPAMAADVRKSGLFSYTMKGNGTAIIVGFDAKTNGDKDVYVPAQIDGYTVSAIGAEAFMEAECECIVMLPETITTIGERAFFASDFTSVQIPASVKVIGTDAFSHMTNIKKMVVTSQNPVFATIDGLLYNKQTKTLIAVPFRYAENTGIITIPNGITEIGVGAFSDFDFGYNWISMSYASPRIALPTSLKTISDNAFAGADIGEMQIPNSVETVGAYAFKQARVSMPDEDSIWGVLHLPSSIKYLGEGAFEESYFYSHDSSYMYIDLGDTQLIDIPDRAFCHVYMFDGWTSMTLPKNLQTIGKYAFEGLNANVKLPSSAISIGDSAFASGSGKFTIPADSQLQTIGESAFATYEFRNDDTTLILPNTLESIGKEAFADIKGIECIVIPPSVTYIGDNFCNRADIILEVEAGSYAEFWASENGYTTTSDSSEEDTSWLN